MNMTASRFALKVLARADSSGADDALVGDLLEEIAHGRSRVWVCQQLVGMYAFLLAASLRRRSRLTPLLVASILAVVLLGSMSVAPASSVLETWLAVYLVTGAVSLFAHMAARTVHSRTAAISTGWGTGD
jgi:hypothetical protein